MSLDEVRIERPVIAAGVGLAPDVVGPIANGI